jgi:hypothetical protein
MLLIADVKFAGMDRNIQYTKLIYSSLFYTEP